MLRSEAHSRIRAIYTQTRQIWLEKIAKSCAVHGRFVYDHTY